MTSIMRVRAASNGWTGGPGLNTVYFVAGDAGGPPGAAEAQLAHDRVRTALFDAKLAYPNTWTATVNPAVDILETETGELTGSFAVTPSANVVGTNPTGYGPLPSMMLVTLNTSTFLDGSRLQGRHFMGPVTLTADSNGTPTPVLIGYFTAYAAALNNPGPGGVPKVVVWRRPRIASAGPPAVTARPGAFGLVTSYAVADKFAVLRSRRD